MLVYIGNPNPVDDGVPVAGPTISISKVEDSAGFVVGTSAMEVKEHLFDNPGLVTHLPGNEAVINIVRTWQQHSDGPGTWVMVKLEDSDERDPDEAVDLERFLSEFWHCPRGFPEDLEDTHYTDNGPPGEGGY